MTDTTVVFECQTCWARAATPDAIRHQAPIMHPDRLVVRRLEFPIVPAPSPGLFGRWMEMKGLPPPYPGWPEHEYIYSTLEGDSCSCGWQPQSFRTTAEEWKRHVSLSLSTSAVRGVPEEG